MTLKQPAVSSGDVFHLLEKMILDFVFETSIWELMVTTRMLAF